MTHYQAKAEDAIKAGMPEDVPDNHADFLVGAAAVYALLEIAQALRQLAKVQAVGHNVVLPED